MFILGNWLKITIHGIFGYEYIEATGNFTGSEEQWTDFFLNSLTITLSLILIATFNIKAPRKSEFLTSVKSKFELPKIRSRSFSHILLFVFIIYGLNWMFGFYRIGVARDLSLPFGLNAPASFMVYLFAPMLMAIVANKTVVISKSVRSSALWILAVVFLIASIVTYSRAIVVILMIPIVIGMYESSYQINGRRQSYAQFVRVLVPTILAALILVSINRLLTYNESGSITTAALYFYYIESLGLVFDRWIGAEGLMTAVSSQTSIELFFKMLIEDPTVGSNGIYQALSGSQYYNVILEGKTFLSLPGSFALLAFSGSFLFLFFGVLLIGFIGILVEQFVVKNFPRQFPLRYLISAALAYHFSQMVFPSLFIPFVVQLIFFLLILKFFCNIKRVAI